MQVREDMSDSQRLYGMGLERVADVDGWAVFDGDEGNDPEFLAFFRRSLAAAVRYAQSVGVRNVYAAVLTPDAGLLIANEHKLATHAELRQRIEAARAAGVLADADR